MMSKTELGVESADQKLSTQGDEMTDWLRTVLQTAHQDTGISDLLHIAKALHESQKLVLEEPRNISYSWVGVGSYQMR